MIAEILLGGFIILSLLFLCFLIGKLILVENFSDNFEEYFKSFLKYSAKHVN